MSLPTLPVLPGVPPPYPCLPPSVSKGRTLDPSTTLGNGLVSWFLLKTSFFNFVQTFWSPSTNTSVVYIDLCTTPSQARPESVCDTLEFQFKKTPRPPYWFDTEISKTRS